MSDLSIKEKLTKKTPIILILFGMIFCISGFFVTTEDMFLIIAFCSIGSMLMIYPLFYNFSDKDEKNIEEKHTPLTKNEIWGMPVFACITFGLIGFYSGLQDWFMVVIIRITVGDVAAILLILVIEDCKKRKNIKFEKEFTK
jgi:hypothetical protein